MKTASALAFVVAAVGACVALAQPAGKIPRIGVLVTGPPPDEHICVQAFRQGLADLGYVEGRTHVLEMRWGKGRPEETFPRFGNELIKLGVDLIVSVTAQGLTEARDAIAAVPVVMAASSYPVERRLINSLRSPGGNITGVATFTGELYTKRLQLLAEALPGLARVTVLRVAGDQSDLIERDLQSAAQLLGLKLQVIGLKQAEDLPAAFRAAGRNRAQAITTTQSPFFYQHIRQIAELALKHRLPSLAGEPTAAEAGILITHGANSVRDSCHRGATFVDRILKGARPADLPVEQLTKVTLAVNLRTARALGITLPPAILLRADRVIE